MTNNKFLQLCRNSSVYDSKSAAISALKTAFGKHKKDGELIISRYYTSAEKVAVKTLLGVSYYSGEGAVVHDTIIDVDAMPSEVQKVIDSLIGGASDEYSTLKKIEDVVKAEVQRAKDAEKANADAITDEQKRATGIESGLRADIDKLNGSDTVSGSVAKSIKDAVEALDVTAVGGQGRLITTVSETNGKISANAIDATAANIAVVDEKDKFTATNVEGVLAEIDTKYKDADTAMGARVDALKTLIGEGGSVEKQINDAIAKLDNTVGQASVADGKHVAVQVVETDGVITAVSVSESDIASAQGLSDEIAARKDADTALDGRLDVIEGEGEGSIKKAVADAKSDLLGGASPNYNTLGKLEGKIQAVEGAAKTYKIEAVNGSLGANVKEAWKLVDEDGTQAGATINIYKDSTLKEVKLVDQVLQFTYILADGSESTVGVDVSKFLAETEFKNGLAVSEGKVSVKIDETSESFLTVGENGVNISGVQDAIDAAETDANHYADGLNTAMNTRVNALETAIGKGGSVETQINNAIANLDVEAVGGQGKLITTVSESDGKISAIAIDATAANIAVADTNNKFTATNVEDVLAEIDTKYKDADSALDGRLDVIEGEGEGSIKKAVADAKSQLLGEVSETDAKTIAALNDKIETAKSDATAAIEALDVPDAAVSTQYVSAVSEADGKISVTRANLVAAAADGNSNDMLSTDNRGSIVLSNVFDMRTY